MPTESQNPYSLTGCIETTGPSLENTLVNQYLKDKRHGYLVAINGIQPKEISLTTLHTFK